MESFTRSLAPMLNSSKRHLVISVVKANRFSTSSTRNLKDKYKLLIVGGGSGGISTGAKFVKKLGAGNVAIVDSAQWHYYQPGWTMAAGGIKSPDDFRREEKSLIPNGIDWHQANAASFDPDNNSVELTDGSKISYDYMIVATGIHIDFDGIKGLQEALKNDSQVVSMYSHDTVKNVFPAIQAFKEGNAIFTFPKMPIKCPGAPQKIMYLAEDYFRKNGKRDKANVIYTTTLPAIFGVKKYAESLMKIVKERNIELHTQTHLIEIDYKNKLAIFEKLDQPGSTIKMNYSLLHVAPPMRPIEAVKKSKLVDQAGFVDIHKETCQHKKYSNIYSIGDCTNMPTGKTAAAVAAQSALLFKNLSNQIYGTKKRVRPYDGYTSCPLITGYGKLILAEFDFNGQPLETFPIDQGKESALMYVLKKDLMPALYWEGMLKGIWNGPAFARKMWKGK